MPRTADDCDTTTASSGAPPGEPFEARDGVHVAPRPFRLHHGGQLDGARLAWRLQGDERLPVVVALGGISAGRDVYWPGARERGWWREVVGPGLALDTRRVRLLGIDWIGGSGGSTGPRPEQTDFPAISSFDQARMLEDLRQELKIERYAAIVGASYGGMVALAFAQLYPDSVSRIVVIGAAHRSHPQATAWRSLQRRIVRFGLEHGDGAGGLRLARALAMVTYRTPREFAQRFTGPPECEGGRYVFPVERYLKAQGDKYLRYIPESYLCLSESIDLHAVDPRAITTPATLIGVTEDQLVPIEDMRALAHDLAGPCRLHEISSLYGHDAFLKENDMLTPLLSCVFTGEAP